MGLPLSASAVSRISRSPERKTRMSPGPLALQLADRVGDGLDLVAVVFFAGFGVVDGAVADLDRVGAAGDLDDRGGLAGARVLEVLGEPLGVDGGGGDDDLEVGAAGQQLPEVAEDEVDVQRPLVGLVDDQGVVAAEVPVGADLGQQDAVGHQLDGGVVAGFVGEPDLVADDVAEVGLELLGDPLGDRAGGDPARLGVADLPGDAAAELEADLGQLGGLPRAGFACDDDHLVVADGGRDVVPALADRQFRGVANGRARDGGLAGGFSGGGALRGPGRVRDRVRGNFVHQRERLDDRYR